MDEEKFNSEPNKNEIKVCLTLLILVIAIGLFLMCLVGTHY